VEEALDGRQGISMAKSNPPDVLLTDVEMPHMNGVEMLRELKAVPALARVPVIVLTTAGKENRERLEELGVSALLPKQDLTEERLRRLIEDVLPDRR
jgi:CheY-like chemotaxis protein